MHRLQEELKITENSDDFYRGNCNLIEQIYKKFYMDKLLPELEDSEIKEATEARFEADKKLVKKFTSFDEFTKWYSRERYIKKITVILRELHELDETRFFKTSGDMFNLFLKLDNREKFVNLYQFLINFLKYFQFELPVELRFIILIAAIESLKEVEKRHSYFQEWVKKKFTEDWFNEIRQLSDVEEFKNIFTSIEDEYNEEFGAHRWVRHFFSRYTDKKDKFTIITKISRKESSYIVGHMPASISENSKSKKPVTKEQLKVMAEKMNKPLADSMMPTCFDPLSCYVEAGECLLGNGFCRLESDDQLLESSLKKNIDILYSFRSQFAHSLRNIYLIPKDARDLAGIITSYKGKPIQIDLGIQEFTDIVIRTIKNYLQTI